MSSPSRTAQHMWRLKGQGGFSLVEAILAIGVVSFAMRAAVGVLPVGLRSAQESQTQVAMAPVGRQLQGELQQISFRSDSSNSLTMAHLAGNSSYYTLEGNKMNAIGGCYLADFAVNDTQTPGSTSAQTATATLSYPQSAPVANRQKSVFSPLLAKQKSG